MSNLALNELQHEALIELLNISSGKATAVLSEMLLSEITISAPELEQAPRKVVAEQIQSSLGDTVASITINAQGAIDGEAILVLSPTSSQSLTEHLMGNQVPAELLPELEGEAMVELGNVILNACLSTFADQLGENITTTIPAWNKGEVFKLIGDEHVEVLFLNVNFISQVGNEHGHIILILDTDAAQKISTLLDRYLQTIMAT